LTEGDESLTDAYSHIGAIDRYRSGKPRLKEETSSNSFGLSTDVTIDVTN